MTISSGLRISGLPLIHSVHFSLTSLSHQYTKDYNMYCDRVLEEWVKTTGVF